MVLDHLAVDKVAGLDVLAAAHGRRLRYPPPYSPDFNPTDAKNWFAHCVYHV